MQASVMPVTLTDEEIAGRILSQAILLKSNSGLRKMRASLVTNETQWGDRFIRSQFGENLIRLLPIEGDLKEATDYCRNHPEICKILKTGIGVFLSNLTPHEQKIVRQGLDAIPTRNFDYQAHETRQWVKN